MAAWDPWAIENQIGSEEKVAAVSCKSTHKEKIKAHIISNEDQNTIAKEIVARLEAARPWDLPSAAGTPDLIWHTLTCDSYDWRHIDVKLEIGEGCAYVILNRANENNSLQDSISHGLNDALFALHARPDLRGVVFTGEGRMFCAGGDPKMWQAAAAALRGEILDGDGTVGVRIPRKPITSEAHLTMIMIQHRAEASGAFGTKTWQEIGFSQLSAAKQWHTWATLPQFVIALLNGSAMGGGVGMTCMCDYAIACKKAYVVVSEVRIGVIPATISPYVIAKIGSANAKRMFNTAENMKAVRAKEAGVLNEVVENMKAGYVRVNEMLKLVQPCAPKAVAEIKKLVFAVAGQPLLDRVFFYTALVAAENSLSEEMKVGRECEINGTLKPWEQTPVTPLY